MNLNKTARVAERVPQLAEQWPNDPRLLEPLYFLALPMAAAVYGHRWFRYSRRHLGLPSQPRTLWPQMLGYLRFQHGGWNIIDALSSMTSALDHGATNRLPFVVAAEAARLLHDVDKALDLLHEALAHHPNDPVLVNNLAFTLSHDKDHISEATALLPILSPLADERDEVLDTMAYILLRANRGKAAYELAAQLTSRTPAGSRYWVRGNRYMAEAAWQQGDRERATRMLTNLIEGQKSMTEEDMHETTQLLARISEKEPDPDLKPPPETIPLPPPLILPDPEGTP
jgi:predicted Zn-dependent protease